MTVIVHQENGVTVFDLVGVPAAFVPVKLVSAPTTASADVDLGGGVMVHGTQLTVEVVGEPATALGDDDQR